jgi:methylenetetrahydrofolate dehydrogenase (NADP+)/methenyltetrahydrofolate cyclohydrolase
MSVMLPSIGPWYSTEEAAKLMGLTAGHVSRLCKEGAFLRNCVKVGNSYLLHESVARGRPLNEFNPLGLASTYHQQQSHVLRRKNYRNKPRILGILAPDAGDTASMVYARTLQRACEDVGFDLGLVRNDLAEVENRIRLANDDPSIHGIFVFYPLFKDQKDQELKDQISPEKDIEGLSSFWANKLYSNDRFADKRKTKKAVLPCTSLGILKILAHVENLDERTGQTFAGKKITIFNRSDVVGRPLAYMLKNDGAIVYSFDIGGGMVMPGHAGKTTLGKSISREDALAQSDIVITGVPSRAFERIRGEEMKENATCLNFSFFQNFETSAKEKAGVYVPRVGPMTIAMCVRNAIRLYDNNRDTYDNANSATPSVWNNYGDVVELAVA